MLRHTARHLFTGTVLIKPDGGNNQTTHYGGDSGNTAIIERANCISTNNTVYSTRSGNTYLRLSTMRTCSMQEICLLYDRSRYEPRVAGRVWRIESGKHWAKTGWRNSFEGAFGGTVTGGSSFCNRHIAGIVDAAAQDFRLVSGAPRKMRGPLAHDALTLNDVIRQYVKHRRASRACQRNSRYRRVRGRGGRCTDADNYVGFAKRGPRQTVRPERAGVRRIGLVRLVGIGRDTAAGAIDRRCDGYYSRQSKAERSVEFYGNGSGQPEFSYGKPAVYDNVGPIFLRSFFAFRRLSV